MKRIIIIFCLSVLLIILFSSYKTTILADEVTGWGTDGTIMINISENINSPYEFISQLNDSGRTDTLIIVIYKEKTGYFNIKEREAIGIRKFQIKFDDNIHLRILKNKSYHRLVEEAITFADNKNSIFTRLYEYYPSNGSQMQLLVENITVPFCSDVSKAMDWLKKNNPKGLQLKENTIVTDGVLESWDSEGYNPEFEFSYSCPEGLTYERLSK